MKVCRNLLVLLMIASVAGESYAGPLFGRNRSNPAERVPQLIVTLKTDQDEHHRADAAHELADFDPAQFPDMIPVLADVARHDMSIATRIEAVQTLGRLRPVNRDAGWALEDATRDPAMRVRLHARTALMGYRLAGYHNDMPASAPQAVVSSPGIPPTVTVVPLTPPPGAVTATRWNAGETAPPPLARPVIATPTSSPVLPSAPTPVVNQGPDLGPVR
jgi:hypothetical protein